MGKGPITLFAFSLGIISNYIVYPRILSPIGILILYLGFKRTSLNLLVLNPGVTGRLAEVIRSRR